MGQILRGKSKFFVKLTEKIGMFRKFAWKNRNFSEICLEQSKFFADITWKNQNFSKICGENPNFLDPYLRPPDFKPDWHCWVVV